MKLPWKGEKEEESGLFICPICSRRSSPEEDAPCMFCFFKGRAFELSLSSQDRAFLLTRIRALDQVVAAEVWHHDNGNFMLAIGLSDGRLLYAGTKVGAMGVMMDGSGSIKQFNDFVVPHIPPAGGEWGIAVLRNGMLPEQEEFDLENDFVITPGVCPDDEGLVQAVSQIAMFNQLLES